MATPLRLLMVEDLEDHAALLARHLRKAGFDLSSERVDTAATMAAALDHHPWDAVVADYNLPSFSALDALALIRQRDLDLPFIIVSGSVGEETAAAAMRAGAHDYIMKDNLTRLVPAIERELREVEERRVRRRAEERIVHLAYHDPLTGLGNRNLIVERIGASLAADKQMALLLLELNRFRDIVNTLGHTPGDHLLVEVAQRLVEEVGKSGMVAHFGGERFAVLLSAAGRALAIELGEQIRSALNRPIQVDGIHLELDVCVGIALAPEHATAAGDLVRLAEVAQSTAQGSSERLAIYNPDQDTHHPRRLALMGQLRNALESGELFLVYQPKIDLHTAHANGVEALVRWRHPTLGLIPPDEFIPLAERAGLIGLITRRVLDQAVHDLQAWRSSGLDISIAVNLSARDLHDPVLSPQVADLLRACSTQAKNLEMEITESHIMEDPTQARHNLLRLSALGVHLSIDDFGTGYSSLGCLRTLPVDALKIDKSFVISGLESPEDLTIVRSTIELGHNLGLSVVAEGVEDEGTLNRLLALNCDAAQGFFFGAPMAEPELRNWLHASPWGGKGRLVNPSVPSSVHRA